MLSASGPNFCSITIVSLPDRVRAPLERVTNAKLSALRRTLEQLDPRAREPFLEGLRLLRGEAVAETRGATHRKRAA